MKIDLAIAVFSAEVVATLGAIPEALNQVYGIRLYDMLSHHRNKVIKRAERNFPSGRRAQQMVASRLWRYTTAKAGRNIGQVVGYAFAALASGKTFGDDRFVKFEHGGSISSKNPMAIPIQVQGKTGEARKHAQDEFEKMLKSGQLTLVGGRYLIFKGEAKRSRVVYKGGHYVPMSGRGTGARTKLIAVLKRGRSEVKRLGYFAAFDETVREHEPRFQEMLDVAVSESEIAALSAKVTKEYRALNDLNTVYRNVYLQEKQRGSDINIARKAAMAAREKVRKTLMAPKDKA